MKQNNIDQWQGFGIIQHEDLIEIHQPFSEALSPVELRLKPDITLNKDSTKVAELCGYALGDLG